MVIGKKGVGKIKSERERNNNNNNNNISYSCFQYDMKGQNHNDRHLCQSRSNTRPRNLICNKFQDAAAAAGLKHIQ